MKVNVMQFVLPNGRQVPVTIELPGDLTGQYATMKSCGARLTAEVLTTGEVSLCIEHPEYGDFDARVVPTGPDVPAALVQMLAGFRRTAFEDWLLDVA